MSRQRLGWMVAVNKFTIYDDDTIAKLQAKLQVSVQGIVPPTRHAC